MPKSIDHAKRRDEIALVACKVVAEYGFAEASVVRIARETGYSTGMIAHYFDSKHEIILAALRLMLRRIEARLLRREGAAAELLDVLGEALPLDPQRYMECAFWMLFVGQASVDKRLKRMSAWVHGEYERLFKRCLASYWIEWADWTPKLRDQTLASLVTFVSGLTAISIVSRSEWPAQRQIEQLSLQLSFLRRHALEVSGASRNLSKKR